MGFGIPVNNSSDPRHSVDADTEYKAMTGEPVSKWANGVGLAVTFDKYSVYPGQNFNEHVKVFSEAAFRLDSRYLIGDLLREQLGYEGVVCTDWGITADEGADIHSAIGGKCWGVEKLSVAERHFKALEAGVDQFGGNNGAGPVLGSLPDGL